MATRKWNFETTVVGSLPTMLSNQLDTAALANGGYVIAWANYDTGRAYAQRYNALGLPDGGAIEIGANFTANPKYDLAVAATPDGGFAVNFTSGSPEFDMYFQRFDASGVPALAVKWDSSTGVQSESAIAIDKNGGLVLLETDAHVTSGEIFAGRVPNGSNTTAFLQVNPATAGPQHASDVAVLTNGNIVYTWIDSNDTTIKFRITDNANVDILPAQTLAAAPANSIPQITPLANGGFVVAWSQASTPQMADNSDYGVLGMVFRGDGVPLTNTLSLNAQIQKTQILPKIAGTPDGGFFAVWQDNAPSNGGSYDINGQQFDSLGNKVGGEITVNTATAGYDLNPAVAALADGRVLVTWYHSIDGSIHQQILDPRDGVVQGNDTANVLFGGDLTWDELDGQGGNDTLYGMAGNDWLTGGDGDDFLHGGLGADQLVGGDGFDYASYVFATTAVTANLGNAALNTGEAAGDSYLQIEGLIGSQFNDVLTGDAGDNRIYGAGGSDYVQGGDGVDVLIGEDGNDLLFGQAGNDWLYGGTGDDQLTGGDGADYLNGEGGFDYARYDGGPAVTADLALSANNTGAAFGDLYFGIEGLVGSAGDDSLRGDDNLNWIYGGDGADYIYGRGGNDVLLGGNGNDVLYGNAGNDSLYGEGGNDTFVFAAGDGHDTIFGGQWGAGASDQVWVATATGVSNFTGLLAKAAQVGGDVVITFDVNNSIVLVGTTLAALNADDFVFF